MNDLSAVLEMLGLSTLDDQKMVSFTLNDNTIVHALPIVKCHLKNKSDAQLMALKIDDQEYGREAANIIIQLIYDSHAKFDIGHHARNDHVARNICIMNWLNENTGPLASKNQFEQHLKGHIIHLATIYDFMTGNIIKHTLPANTSCIPVKYRVRGLVLNGSNDDQKSWVGKGVKKLSKLISPELFESVTIMIDKLSAVHALRILRVLVASTRPQLLKIDNVGSEVLEKIRQVLGVVSLTPEFISVLKNGLQALDMRAYSMGGAAVEYIHRI